MLTGGGGWESALGYECNDKQGLGVRRASVCVGGGTVRFHTMNLCIQNSFVELNTSNLVG